MSPFSATTPAHGSPAAGAPAPAPAAEGADPGGPTPGRILVVGGGGRENALAWALARCPGVEAVWLAPGNGGSGGIAGCHPLPLAEDDTAGLLAACRQLAIDLVVVGPEAPLAAGLADQLREAGLAVFGPGAAGAQLEASKQWAKALMVEAGIPTARHWPAASLATALEALEAHGQPLVVKADGLAAGKGVTVAATLEEARAAIQEVFAGRFGEAGSSLVLEETLQGPEVSVFALTDGQDMVLLPPAQDHKRIGEGDTGANTGGMGAYAPAPLLDTAGLEQTRQLVLEPTLRALRARGIDYRGVIYAGLMLTATGPRVIEFNCRFGDPECETLMPLLGPELARVLLACARGQLRQAPPLTILPGCSACVIAAAEGYPAAVRSGDLITSELQASDDRQLFHAGSRLDAQGHCRTAGGRVLAMVAQAEDFDTAFDRAYDGLSQVHFEGISYRRDIGHQVRRRPGVAAAPSPAQL
ncbi:MAG: phosphoribosylamine--glycine ligase [Cyanobium sp.]